MKAPANLVLVQTVRPLTDTDSVISFDPAIAPLRSPEDTDGQTAYAVLLDDLNTPSKFEIVSFDRVEFRRIWNVTRGKEGTTPESWPVGTYVAQDITARMAEILTLSGATGEALLATLSGMEFGDIDYRSVAGKPAMVSRRILDGAGSPATPASGRAVVYFNQLSSEVRCKFDTGSESVIAAQPGGS